MPNPYFHKGDHNNKRDMIPTKMLTMTNTKRCKLLPNSAVMPTRVPRAMAMMLARDKNTGNTQEWKTMEGEACSIALQRCISWSNP